MRILLLNVIVLVVAILLNFVWEMSQGMLYAHMGTFWQATLRCFVASAGDGLLTLVVVGVGVSIFRSSEWFVNSSARHYVFAAAVGLAVAVVVEHWGLATGRWVYGARMPRVPGTELGLVPLMQLVLLTPTTFWIVARIELASSHRTHGLRLK